MSARFDTKIKVVGDPWTVHSVATRFELATSTGHALPPVRVQGYFNVWPAFVRDRWERMAADDLPPQRFPPSPEDVDSMLEVMQWVLWLSIEERHVVWMRADRYEWQHIARRFACCTKTAQRRWQRAMQTVADHLNAGDTVNTSDPWLVRASNAETD